MQRGMNFPYKFHLFLIGIRDTGKSDREILARVDEILDPQSIANRFYFYLFSCFLVLLFLQVSIVRLEQSNNLMAL